MAMGKLSGLTLALILLAPSLVAQELQDFQKVLLPAFSNQSVRGVNGSVFSTVLRGYTDVDTIVYPGHDPSHFHRQPAFNPLFNDVLRYGSGAATGRFLFIESERAGDLSLQYYLLSSDARDETTDQRTSLPIVREPHTGVTRMLGIPSEPILVPSEDGVTRLMAGYRHRLLLRAYDWEGDGTRQLAVQPYHEGLFGNGGALGPPVVLTLNRRDGDDPSFPWYAELPIEKCVPFSRHTPCTQFSMRVELTPLSEGLRYWAFVTATDNRTQHVTVFEAR